METVPCSGRLVVYEITAYLLIVPQGTVSCDKYSLDQLHAASSEGTGSLPTKDVVIGSYTLCSETQIYLFCVALLSS